jgi:hypothetical protein
MTPRGTTSRLQFSLSTAVIAMLWIGILMMFNIGKTTTGTYIANLLTLDGVLIYCIDCHDLPVNPDKLIPISVSLLLAIAMSISIAFTVLFCMVAVVQSGS